ncbi:MAG: TMEM14 family protein [Prochloraceae cyanobacterium]
MSLKILITVAYGIIVLVGGAIGYSRAGSKKSLIAGAIAGLLLLSAAIAQSLNFGFGLILAKIVTLLLLVVFTIRLIKTRKFMPAGVSVVISSIVLVILSS